MSIRQDIRDKSYNLNFGDGLVRFDRAELLAIDATLTEADDLALAMIEHSDKIDAEIEDIREARKDADDRLTGAIKLAEANDLPDRFVKAFCEILREVKQDIHSIDKCIDNIESVSEAIDGDATGFESI